MVKRMLHKIIIENLSLANYLMFQCNKIDNSFSEEELLSIKEIIIDYKEEENPYSLPTELLLLKNLETLTIRNGYLYNSDYTVLMNLNQLIHISFEKCQFENADLIASLPIKQLSLVDCPIQNYSFLKLFKNLEQLILINATIEFEILNCLHLLNYLQLSYSTIVDQNHFLHLEKLKFLYIDHTNISNLSCIQGLFQLKVISIDKNQYQYNKKLIESLLKKNIRILNEGILEFKMRGATDNE